MPNVMGKRKPNFAKGRPFASKGATKKGRKNGARKTARKTNTRGMY